MEVDADSNYTAEERATYQKIKEYVLEKYGLKVHSLYIAQMKDKCGLGKERTGNSWKKNEDGRVPQCTPEKEEAIVDAMELYDELIAVATRYAEMRAKWLLMEREEKMEKDSLRTSYYNSVILHFNMLARYLKSQGKEAVWRDMLGYEEEDGYNRKSIGDFTCYLVFVNSINAR